MRASRRTMTALVVVLQAITLSCSDSESLAPTSRNGPPADQLKVVLSTHADTLELGASRTYSARVINQFNEVREYPVDWSATNPAVIDISRLGIATAVGAGSTQIIAKAAGAADTAMLVVEGGVTALSISPLAVSAYQGDSLHFSASATLTSGLSIAPTNVVWTSSDTGVATVGANGVVTSVGAGDATIQVQYLGVAAAAAVNVKNNGVASVTVSPANASIIPGGTTQLSATLRDGNGKVLSRNNVAWSSSNADVATVSGTGLVTGVTSGFAFITAESSGSSATATITVLSTPASAVTVNLPSGSFSVGQTMQATATVTDVSGSVLTGRPIAWQSSNPSIATVNSSGLVAGVAVGNVTISAIVDAVVGRASLSVVNAVPTSLSIVPASVSLNAGQTTTLSARELDQSGKTIANHKVTWSTSNPAVASLSDSVVHAVAQGSATISASVDGLQATAAITVGATPAASLTVSPTSLSLVAGSASQITATAKDASGNVLVNRAASWTSSNSAVAAVSPTGLVTGVGGGSAVVTATVDGLVASTSVTVSAPSSGQVASIEVTLNSESLAVGQTTHAAYILRDANGNLLTNRFVTWASSPRTVASISGDGTVSAMSAGTSSIIATAEDGVSGAASVTVDAPPAGAVSTVTVTAAYTAIVVGGTSQLTVTLRDASENVLSGRTIAYSSSSTSIGTVTPSGLVTATGAGTVTITATSEGVSGSVVIQVAAGTSSPLTVATVSVTLGSSALTAGQTTQATAVARDASGNIISGQTISWSTTSTAVATVSSAGVVTAMSAGTASIVATTGGKSGSTSVTVSGSAAPVASVTTTLASTSLDVGQSTQASVVLRDASGNLLTGRSISFSSSNAAVASVSSTGLVNAVAAGTAQIKATSEGVVGSASVTVSVPTTPGGMLGVLPELPRVYLNTQYSPPTGTVWNVPSGGNLQSALNSAQPGDIIKLAAGATYTGTFILPKHAACGEVVLTTNTALPPPGTRVTPATAASYAKIQSATTNVAAIRVAPGACGWRVMGVTITAAPSLTSTISLVDFGDGSSAQNTDAKIPSNLILDRAYVHGFSTLNFLRCVALHSKSSAVIDSYLSECHAKGFDSQAIVGWNGPGPYKIVNNYLEGAGENVMFGGADPQISGMLPSDIEFRQNYVYKPLSWKGVWTIKNSFELKMGIRVLIEGNVFENNWIDAQTGDMIAFKSANTSNAPWTETRDVTFQYNVVKNTPNGITSSANPAPLPVVPMSRLRITNNLLQQIGTANGTSMGRGMFFSRVAYVQVEHNTVVHNITLGTGAFLNFDVPLPKMLDFVVRNNVADAGSSYGMAVFGSGLSQGIPTLDGYSSPWQFDRNVIAGMTGPVSAYPAGNYFPTSTNNIGYTNMAAGDYSLSATSSYRGMATDGTNPGADMTTLNAKTAGVTVR
jgi:uncharacterized protein YjdB